MDILLSFRKCYVRSFVTSKMFCNEAFIAIGKGNNLILSSSRCIADRMADVVKICNEVAVWKKKPYTLYKEPGSIRTYESKKDDDKNITRVIEKLTNQVLSCNNFLFLPHSNTQHLVSTNSVKIYLLLLLISCCIQQVTQYMQHYIYETFILSTQSTLDILSLMGLRH